MELDKWLAAAMRAAERTGGAGNRPSLQLMEAFLGWETATEVPERTTEAFEVHADESIDSLLPAPPSSLDPEQPSPQPTEGDSPPPPENAAAGRPGVIAALELLPLQALHVTPEEVVLPVSINSNHLFTDRKISRAHSLQGEKLRGQSGVSLAFSLVNPNETAVSFKVRGTAVEQGLRFLNGSAEHRSRPVTRNFGRSNPGTVLLVPEQL